MLKKISYLFLLVLFSSFSLSDFLSKHIYVYLEKTEQNIVKTTWNLKKDGDKIVADKVNDIGIAELEYNLDFSLKKFSYKSVEEKADYVFSLDKNRLRASGIYRGKKMNEGYNTNLPWVQEFTFGMQPFLRSNKNELSFYILRPETFELIELIAIKKVIEKIHIGDTTYNTQKLKITLPGFKGHFWKAEAWYDLETNHLLKYKANEGPGTPLTTIVLSS